jgi:hypothetical protein
MIFVIVAFEAFKMAENVCGVSAARQVRLWEVFLEVS